MINHLPATQAAKVLELSIDAFRRLAGSPALAGGPDHGTAWTGRM